MWNTESANLRGPFAQPLNNAERPNDPLSACADSTSYFLNRTFIPVAFCATLAIIGRKNHWRISRIVTLPDFQGIGIGMRFMEAIADLHIAEGHRLNVTASHPALIAHCRRSPHWRAIGIKKTGSHHTERFIASYHGSAGRAVVSFEYTKRNDKRETMNDEVSSQPFSGRASGPETLTSLET
jgi:GNAT superfamily N-acetyltransferase